MMHQFDHHTPGHPYEIKEHEEHKKATQRRSKSQMSQPYMDRVEGGTTWQKHDTDFVRRLNHTITQPGRSAPKHLPYDPQRGEKIPEGRPSSQAYWDQRFAKEPRVGELVSPDGFTAVAMEHAKEARLHQEKAMRAMNEKMTSTSITAIPRDIQHGWSDPKQPKPRTPAKNAKRISPGIPSTFKVAPKKEAIERARREAGFTGGGGGGEGFIALPVGADGTPPLPGYLVPPPYGMWNEKEKTPPPSSRLYGIKPREGRFAAAKEEPDYPDPGYNKQSLPKGYPWAHKGKPRWKERTPYYTAHRTRGDHEIAQMQGQGNLMKEVREWSGAEMNPYDSGQGPMQVGYDFVPSGGHGSVKPKTPVDTSKVKKPSEGLPNTFKTIIDKLPQKPPHGVGAGTEMENLNREHEDLRRMITKRISALPGENPNQVPKMKAKLERRTPFGRSRRRLDDVDKARMEGGGNLMKEVRQWSGAETNAYDTAAPGPLTRGYEHEPAQKPDYAKGDKFALGASAQSASAELPSTFKVVEAGGRF